jgi:hypothetical protein
MRAYKAYQIPHSETQDIQNPKNQFYFDKWVVGDLNYTT